MIKKAKNNSLIKILNSLHGRLALIALIAFLAYFQTLFMYFWNDDNAIIFKLQHLNEGMGNLGSGIFGLDSPYRMVIFTLVPLFYVFGINSQAFFAYGIFFYFLTSIAVFFFARSIFKNDNLSLLTSLIFAGGFVGAESLWRVYNSVHTSITIAYIVLFCTFYFYSTYQKKLSKILLFYVLALIFYIAAIQWGYVRAHGIVLIAVAIELLFNFSLKYSFFRLIPFIYSFNLWYVIGSNNSHHFKNLITQIFIDYNFQILLVPLRTLQNVLIPDNLQIPFLAFLIFLIFLIFKFRSRILFFSLFFIVSGYVTYFVMYYDQVLNSTHRYLTASLPGVSIFVVYIFSRLFRTPKKLYFAAGVYIILILVLVNWTHYKILVDRTIPTKKFYSTLTNEIKSLNKNSIIYFDTDQSEKSKNQFKEFFGVGSMPDSTAIAIYYNLDRYDVILPQTFTEFINTMNSQSIKSENVFSFFYSADKGLINTTTNLRKGLFDSGYKKEISDLKNINFSASAPFRLELTMNPALSIKNYNSSSIDLNYVKYLTAKSEYYKSAEATSSSEWKNQEINFINDNNTDTSWMSHRVHWHYNSHDEVIIDLKQAKKIGGVKLSFGPTDKAPTKYNYSCSVEGKKWVLIGFFYNSPRNHGEEKTDKFNSVECRYLKMELFDTPKKDAPIITELEVINYEYTNLDSKKIKNIEKEPIKFINQDNYKDFINYFENVGFPIEICLITDKQPDSCKKLAVKINSSNIYSRDFEPSGTSLKSINIKVPQEVDLRISNPLLSYLSISELKL